MKNRTEIAKAYYKFLMNIDWNDKFYAQGIRDGRKTFLTNAFLGTCDTLKYLSGDYYSPAALEKLKHSSRPSGLIFEHMVPKTKYIHAPCEEKAKTGTLNVQFIEEILQKYWKIAILTKEEDMRLSRNSMPENWDGEDILGRYAVAGITLIEKP